MTSKEDPLVAALPPVTDYITYLTILEYQLTPQNLPTLNRLLSDDDGTLAKEIGWDLLKLVLPMIVEEPNDVRTCLEIIARRGNPREVVVRVAEELERLGQQSAEDSDLDQEYDDETEDDGGLVTFAGEAQRIHLGKMILDGSQPAVTSGNAPDTEQRREDEDDVSSPLGQMSLSFQILISMLSLLHPRIKTQYPSRFLATSLPAALGAYRRLRITSDTTLTFLDCLGKLSGKQRPRLPPRNSITSAASASTLPPQPSIVLATLPDPEAKASSDPQSPVTEEDRAITSRLLQAVMLEVLDDYMSSVQDQPVPHMSWTLRARENLEPMRTVPGSLTETEKWKTNGDLAGRDAIFVRFLSLAKDLDLDIENAFDKTLMHNMGSSSDSEVSKLEESAGDDEPSEFPTSPDQIPFPSSGVLFLYCAQLFHQITSPAVFTSATTSKAPSTLPTIFPDLANFYHSIRSPANRSYIQSNYATEDALLTLLLLSLTHPPSSPSKAAAAATTTTPSASSPQPAENRTLFLSLAHFCADCSDAQLRDAAYTVATKLLEQSHTLSQPAKLAALKALIGLTGKPNLRAVAVGWLKAELLLSANAAITEKAEAEAVASASALPGIDAADAFADAELRRLLFPDARRPPPPSTGADDSDAGNFEAQIPFYTATMNLVFVVCRYSSTNAALAAALRNAPDFTRAARAFHDTLQPVAALPTFGSAGSEQDVDGGNSAGEAEAAVPPRADVWALEDALRRASEALAELEG